MSAFQSLDDHLATDFSKNYWSDEGVVYAMELSDELAPEDWDQLATAWAQRPESWQARCADVLADVDPAFSVPILGAMIGSEYDTAAMRAADSLRTILEAHADVTPPPEVLARAEELAGRAQGAYARSLDQLIGRLRRG